MAGQNRLSIAQIYVVLYIDHGLAICKLASEGGLMTILITTGYQEYWCEHAQLRQSEMGIKFPINGEVPNTNPNQFLKKMYRAHMSELVGGNDFSQIQPSKPWQISAAQVVLEHSEIDNWGWSNTANIHFLDFWADYDPSTRFILLYGSLNDSLARDVNDDIGEKELATKIGEWIAYHEATLEFYHRNSQRSALVHISAFEENAKEASLTLESKFNIQTHRLNSRKSIEQDPIAWLAAKTISENSDSAENLFIELESCADAKNRLAMQNVSTLNEFKKYKSLKTRNKALQDSQNEEISSLQSKVASLEDKLTEKQNEKFQIQRQLEASISEITELKSNFKLSEQSSKKKIDSLSQKWEDAKREVQHYRNLESNRMQQLHSLQQEYEKLLLNNQNSQTYSSASLPANISNSDLLTSAPLGIRIDFAGDIKGEGWHDPEQFGRWGGPSHVSSTSFHKLTDGDYEIKIWLLNAMSLDLLEDLKIFLDGVKLEFKCTRFSQISGRLKSLKRVRALLDNSNSPYPLRIDTIVHKSDIDSGYDEHKLTFQFPRSISPKEFGSADSRELTAFFQKIEIRSVTQT